MAPERIIDKCLSKKERASGDQAIDRQRLAGSNPHHFSRLQYLLAIGSNQ